MIPADSFLLSDDGTTAAVVTDFVTAVSVYNGENRPCDTCGGKEPPWLPFGPGAVQTVCVARCIDGRHTFTIEVERGDVPVTPYPESRNPFGDRPRLGPQDCAHFEDCEMYEGDKRCRYAGCSYNFTQIFRVHVLDVLPVYGGYETRPVGHIWVNSDGDAWLHDINESHIITMPPAAQPGTWLVRLAVRKGP